MTDAPALEIFDDDVRRVLCVVAHPDDMEYGASAAVAEWTARGAEVSYLLLTRGEAGIRSMTPDEVAPLRAEEQRRACAIVGADDPVILDFPDGLLEAGIAQRRAIARRIRQFRPDAVVCTTWALEVPWGLNHVDHRHAGIATVDAIRDADNPWLYREQITDEGLEAWHAGRLIVTGAGEASTHVVGLSAESVDKGIASLEAHSVYLAALPGHPEPAAMIGQITAGGGAAVGLERGLPVRVIPM